MTEHALSNLLPNILGVMLIPHHWSQMVFTFCYLEIGTIQAHSGYALPGGHSPLQHDYHHFAFTENFGPTGLADWFHGTSTKFYKALSEARDACRGDDDKARSHLLEKLATAEFEEAVRNRTQLKTK